MIYVVLAVLGLLAGAIWQLSRQVAKLQSRIDNIARDVAALRSRSL